MAVDWRYILPGPIRQIPADIAIVFLWTGATLISVGVPTISETPLRVFFGLPFFIFIPGYALLALLFPEGSSSRVKHDPSDPPNQNMDQRSELDTTTISSSVASSDPEIDGLERVMLSVGLSLAVVPLLLLGVNFTPWGLRLWPISLSVASFVVGTSTFAIYRRRLVEPSERFSINCGLWLRQAHDEIFNPVDRTDGALNMLLAISLLIGLVSAGYILVVPTEGEQFTELYLLTGDGEEKVAANYPEELTAGGSTELILAVGNNEFKSVDYTVVVQIQRVATVSNDTRVEERRRLRKMEFSLSHNQTEFRSHSITPNVTGSELRLKYLLYRGEPPEIPTASNAYRDVHIYLNVTSREDA